MLFDFCAQSFCLIPGVPGKIIRACFYKQTLKKSYLDLDIGFGSLVSKIETSIGKNVLITGHTTIGLTEIGDRAVIANYVSILSGRYQHNFTDLKDDILTDKDCFAKIIIGPDSFIGEHSTVMANVGSHTIVGAGSVVVKPIPDYVVAVGNPARVVKERRTTTAQS
jgi:acetyltransferase-like isoleucine patch superfamily enzyme